MGIQIPQWMVHDHPPILRCESNPNINPDHGMCHGTNICHVWKWGTSVVYQCFISVLNGSSHSGMIPMIPNLLGEWITPRTVGFMGVISKQHTWRVAASSLKDCKIWEKKVAAKISWTYEPRKPNLTICCFGKPQYVFCFFYMLFWGPTSWIPKAANIIRPEAPKKNMGETMVFTFKS